MGNTQTCCDCLNMEDFHQNQIICFLEIMLTEENSHWKLFVYFQHTKSNIQRTFFYYEETMNVLVSTEFTGFMTNVRIPFVLY